MTTITAPTGATTPTISKSTAGSALSSDFDTFLRMLTVQIQNQDPLNPMESTEFAAQLATFAGVEQQIRTNDHLSGLSAQLGLTTMSQLSGWIGMEARISGPARFDGTPITLSPNPPALADSAQLIVRDSTGNEVQRLPVAITASEIAWPGTDSTGTPLPDGVYSFYLESHSAGSSLGLQEMEHYAIVREAQGNGAGGVRLVFDGGLSTDATVATALRKPPQL